MAHDGCQTPSWYGQAFSYLPKTHRAEPHQAPPSAASAFAAAVATSGGYRSVQQSSSSNAAAAAPQGYSNEDALRAARTGTWDGPAPRGRGEKAAPIEPVKPAPASRTETSVSLGAGRKRLPLRGIQFFGGEGAERAEVSSSLLPLNVVVDVDDASSVTVAAAALRGLSEPQQREDEVFLTLILDGASVVAAVRSADAALEKLGRSTADLVLLDWSKVIDLEREQPSSESQGAAGREAWTAAARELLGSVSGEGRRRARALGLANAGLADVETLLSLADETSKSASPAPRPAALAVELHPLLPQRKLVGVCRRKGVAMIALNPAGNGNGHGACSNNTKALLESAAVAAAAAAEGKSPREVLLRWSAERGIPFAAASASSSPSSSSSSPLFAELAAVPCWALSPASRDALDGAAAVAAEEGPRTLVPKAGAGFVFPGASEGGAVKASEVLLRQKESVK